MNAFVSALVNGALVSAAAAVCVWLALRLAPRRTLNAATRFAIWWVVLLSAVFLPLLYLRPPQRVQTPRPSAMPAAQPAAPRHAFAPAFAAAAISTPVPSAYALPILPLRVPTTPWTGYVLFLWATAALAMLLRLAVGVFALALRSRRGTELPRSVKARRKIRIASSGEIPAPVAAGPWHPTILIPEALLDSLDNAELNAVILHEAAHLQRYDDWSLLVQRGIEAVCALHPVVRWVARRIDFEREIACDDVVIAATGAACAYASCLVRMADLCGDVPPAALAGAAAVGRRSHLSRRIDILMERRRYTETGLSHRRVAWTVAALAGVAALVVHLPAPVVFAESVRRAATRVLARPAMLMAPLAVSAAPQQSPASGFDARVLEDSSGNPLASAELRFHKAGQIELAADLDTDVQGRARAPLPPGEYLMDVVKPNFVTTSVKVKAPLSGLTVRLVRYGIISGQVTDQQGHPEPGTIHASYGRTIGGTRIAILIQNPRGELQKYREATLEDEGRYRIYDLRPGQYAVAVAYDGLKDGSGFQMYPDAAHPRIFSVAGGEEYRDINFTVAPRAAFDVSGRVRLPDGQNTYALALASPDQPLYPIAQTWTEEGSNGAFHFTKIPAGVYDLFAAGPAAGYGGHEVVLAPKPSPQFARLRVNVGQNVEGLDIAVSVGRTFVVSLKASGADRLPEGCPQSTSVALDVMEPWGILQTNRPRAAFGKEQFTADLAPARYRVRADALGPNCYQVNAPVADLTGNTPEPVAIEVAAAGSIQGVAQGTNLMIVLLPEEPGPAKVIVPGAEGKFAFDALPPGRYRIAARSASDPKSRWVTDVTHMQLVEVAGGKPTHVDLEVKP